MEKNWENKVNFNLNLRTGKTSVGFWLKLMIIRRKFELQIFIYELWLILLDFIWQRSKCYISIFKKILLWCWAEVKRGKAICIFRSISYNTQKRKRKFKILIKLILKRNADSNLFFISFVLVSYGSRTQKR